MKSTKPTDASSGIAALAGDSFLLYSQFFIESLPADLDIAVAASQDIGGLLASATNLCLAIEIYLKAVLLHNGIGFPHIHNLSKLYDLIPTEVQDRILIAYKALEKDIDSSKVPKLELELGRSASFPENEIAFDVDNSISALLSRNEDAFVTWRYAFSALADKDNTSLIYEFLHLTLIGKAIRGQLSIQLNLG
jgi:hypothetical protein